MTGHPSGPRLTRRAASLLTAALLTRSPAGLRAAEDVPDAGVDGRLPVVFVHGDGDSKAVWTTTVWRFESSGYSRERLFAVELESPTATHAYDVPEDGRSTAGQAEAQLARFVQEVLRRTRAGKVVLVGNSRGANTIRDYLENGGGAAVTAKAVLGGGVNHGIIDIPAGQLPEPIRSLYGRSEYNGAAGFLRRLNAGSSEVVPGVAFLTLRSDRFDKYAQPDARYLGFPGRPTGVGHGAPALRGATNLVLPGVDHRETAFAPQAFAAMFRFITGKGPRTIAIRPEPHPVLAGRITGVTAGLYDNVGAPGATLRVYRVRPRTGERVGEPAYSATAVDGRWGPFRACSDAHYEFVVTVPGQPVTHIYRSPFPRGSSLVTLRPALTEDASPSESTVVLIRPRGYFGVRDEVLLDGARPSGIPDDPVPVVASVVARFPAATQRPVPTRFAEERITVRTWPATEVSFAEFHY